MVSAEGLSAPGSATYDSDTMTVGDGTWDFTKNTFLLPNLQGLNFETMQYNGMGNRFSTVSQYHSLVTGHAILAAITFLFIIPVAVMYVRFLRDHRKGVRIHSYLQIVTVGLSTIVFILGFFAVGPSRNLSNPHHGIGVAIYVMILVQAIGGSLVRNIGKKSLRLMLHRWLGTAVTILGIVQVPLGLTLYGSPKYTFILFAVWMGFLLFLWFVLSWRHEPDWDDSVTMYGGRSQVGRSESGVVRSEARSKVSSWFAPLAAGAGALAFASRRKKNTDRSQVRGESPSRSGRTPEVLPSRRGSPSYYLGDEKYSERTDRRDGGLMNKLLGVAGILGAGAFAKKVMSRRENRRYDEEYSAVETDTPSRFGARRPRATRKHPEDYTESDFTEDRTELNTRPRTPLLPGPGNRTAAAAALSAAEPLTPRASHARPVQSRLDSNDVSDYTSWVSQPRRAPANDHQQQQGGAARGILAALGLGWLMKKLRDRREKRPETDRYREEDSEYRSGYPESSYLTDVHETPTRRPRQRPIVGAPTWTTMTEDTDPSLVESRPPMPPLGAAAGYAGTGPARASRSRSRSWSRPPAEHVAMPPMPEDPRGVLHPLHAESGTESHASPPRRDSSRRRRESDAAGRAEGSSRQRNHSQTPSQSVSVKVKYHDDRNVTLRRLTEDEARREQRRGRSGSVSSLSESETQGRRYRRDGSRPTTADKTDVERHAPEPLSPPTPAFAGGRRAGKDSAYYSGQPGPSGGPPPVAPTVSSVDPSESHGTWSAISPSPPGPTTNRPPGSVASAAAERRRKRKLNRQPPGGGAVDYS
ncbi:hypothetical protein GGS20DRAFT_338376 [Poronia punctata]|nr:hypothetical protein GGS20DRAFT_338376 [Poronia punctata]